jgi:hypothetical protein
VFLSGGHKEQVLKYDLQTQTQFYSKLSGGLDSALHLVLKVDPSHEGGGLLCEGLLVRLSRMKMSDILSLLREDKL